MGETKAFKKRESKKFTVGSRIRKGEGGRNPEIAITKPRTGPSTRYGPGLDRGQVKF